MENITIGNFEYKNNMSVNNDFTVADVMNADDEEFEKLLDEFVKQQFDEPDDDEKEEDSDDFCEEDDEENDDENDDDDNDDDDNDEEDEEEFKEFKFGQTELELGGYRYTIPKQPYCCKASGLTIDNDSYDRQHLKGEPVVIDVNNELYSDICIVAKEVKGFKEEYTPVIYVYKASESHPILRVESYYYDDENFIGYNTKYFMSEYPDGNYFMLIWGLDVENVSTAYRNCDGGFCIPFVKVNGDIELPAVALEKIDINTDSSGECLDVSLGFGSMLDKRYAYSLYLYNRSYNLVARGATFPWDTFSNRKRKNLKAHLYTSNVLFGEYTLCLVQNSTPCWKIDISIYDGKVVSTGISAIKPFSKEYIILSELERRTLWRSFRESNAPLSMKDYFVNNLAHSYMNNLRNDLRLKLLVPTRNFVYNGGYSPNELESLSKMIRLFWNVSYFNSADCVTLTEGSNAAYPNNDANEFFEFCRQKCFALYNITALVGNGAYVVNKMLETIEGNSCNIICLIGTPGEVEQVLESFPQLRRHFQPSDSIPGDKVYADTFVTQVAGELKNLDLKLSPSAQRHLANAAREAEETGNLRGMSVTDVTDFVKTDIVDNFVSRTLSTVDKKSAEDKEFLMTIEACDINKDKLVMGADREFEESIKELNMMVGLENVKKNITTTFNRLKISAERKRLGLKVKRGECHHMIFTGNPGTGKTTVAKMMGRIYRSLGLLSKGEVVFTDRGKIVGRYIGETERNMQRILQEARGNILFVDEAYTLCDSLQDRKDFGYRAIECLLTVMAQENSDMIVIFAGYTKEMDMMMRSNQGLSGRFPYKFEFEDYTADELMQIAEHNLMQEDYELTEEARSLLHKTIEEAVDNKEWDFCNARWIKQYVGNGIVTAQSERLMSCFGTKSRDDYRRVTVDDVAAAYALHKPVKKSRKVYREIGFTA